MKSIFCCILLIIGKASATMNASDGQMENVSLKIDGDVVVELSAKKNVASNPKPANGLCIYRGQLWVPTMTDPPYKIMLSGFITIGEKRIELDVSGLATPWVDSSDMTKDDFRLRKHELGGNEPFYTLDVCFFKGGAMDYMVTWLIYKDKSRRESIIDVGDVYPDWYKKDRKEE